MNDLFRGVGHRPHAGQAELHACPRRFQLLVAGARFGKSWAAAHEVLLEAACGPVRAWMVAPNYSLKRPEFQYVRNAARRMGIVRQARDGGRAAPSRLSLATGAEVWALSALQPHTLLGEELDMVVLCEAAHLRPDVWPRYLRPRLATRRGRMLLTTTPRGSNWVHELYTRAHDGGDWHALRFATWQNPRIDAEEIESARASLAPDVFDEQYGAEFTALSGRVYPEFAPAVHVAETKPPPGAVVTRGIDFGFTNPFACLWLCRDGDRVLVLREYHQPRRTIEEHARAIRAIDEELRSQGLRIGQAFADPSGRLERETLARGGVVCAAASGQVRGGIDLVRNALAVRDGRPGLVIDPRCANLIREFELYRWAETPGGLEPVPAPGADHALDALRYALTALTRRVTWHAR